MSDDVLVIDGRKWLSPLTRAPKRTVGRARLHRAYYKPGFYGMEGIGGHRFYRVAGGRLPVTALQRLRREDNQWYTWMVDDPLHWLGMKAWTDALPAGHVLCAGLGLGLMIHTLQGRTDITEITVVEIDPSVIELIYPTLPRDPRVRIVEGDYYRVIEDWNDDAPDSILWDLAVGSAEETRPAFLRAEVMTKVHLPDTPLFCFGLRYGGEFTRRKEAQHE